MKQLLSVIITLTICLPIVAQNITEEQALQKAQAFMQGKVMNNSNGRNGAPARPRAMKRVAQAIQSDALYIFNVEDNGGYVIVSGDERTDEILGYSTEGHIDPQQMPENMRAWIEGYEEQIKAIPTSYIGSPAKVPTHPAVEPLITAKWNQDAPYNLHCPEQIPEGGTEPVHCVTGCVATALAQIMYYHKWPKDATTTIPAYNYGKWVYDEETGDGHNEYHEDELSPTTFEWDLMKDSYDYNDTGAEAQAVAKLMRYCGQAVTMKYTPSSSGANPNPQPLIEYFGYDEHARRVTSGYGIAVWDSIIYNEIKSRRPVWHSGSPDFYKVGHCFVLDGYDGNGYFHVNWGWGGSCDGYFTINRLTPNGSGIGGAAEGDGYSYGQSAVIGIMPPGSPSEPQESGFGLLCSIPSIVSGDGMSGPYTALTYSLMTRTNEIIDFDAGIRIEGIDGTDYEETRILDLIPSSAGGWAMEVRLDALPYGHYRFTPLWRLTDTMEWQECNRHFFISKEGDNSGDYKLVYNYNLTASIEAEGSLVTNREQKIKVSLTNHGDEIYQKPLYFCLSSSEEGIIKSFTEYLFIEENGTDFFTYSFWPQQSGTYHVSVVFDGQSIGEADFEVTNGIEVSCGVSCNYEEDKLLLDIWNNDTRAYNHPLLLKIWTAGHDKSTAVEYVTDQLSVPAGGYVKVEIPSSRELSLDSLYYYELNYYPNPDNDVAIYYTFGMITDCDGSSVLLNELNDNAFVIADQSQHLACINWFFSDEEYAFLPGRVANDGQLYTVKSVSNVCGLFANLIVGEGIVNTLFSITNDQLKSVTLPSTLKNVRDCVFSQCTNIDAIYMKSTVPPKIYDWEGKTSDLVLYAIDENGYDVSYQGYKQTMLYVPTGCSGVYRNASGWGQFENIVEMNVDDMPSTTNIDDQPQDDIDLSQYTLLKQFDLAGFATTYFTIDNADQRGTAWETGNKLHQKIYNVIIPEEFSDYLALQAVYNGSGKGWWISHDKGGLYSISASRSAAVLNRKAGDLVVFESYNSDITTAMTLYNGEGEPDGPFTYFQSTDATKYYVSLTGDGQVGFCGNKNGSPITRISIYEPKVKPISVKANDLTMEYGDDVPVLTWSATQDGLPVSIIGEPELYTETTKDSKPGNYTIYCRQGSVSTAGVLFANGTLTITKPTVTVTAPTLTIKKGDPLPELIPTYEGFKNGWTAEQLTIQAICTTEATSDSPAGVYPITFSQNPNSGGYFNFEMVEGTLTIEEQQQPTVEVTDISQMDNVIYIEPMEAKSGEEVSVSLKMKNTAAIRGFQFDLYLPEGMTLAKNDKERFLTSISAGRLPEDDEHTLTVSQQDDGSYRFLCGSLYEETFLGNDGEIATMTLNIAADMEEGDYPLYLRNIKLSENDISKYYEMDEVKSKLTINSYILGDINSDGKVDVSDYIGIANRILGNTPDGFNEKAADVDENGVIDVSDYIGVANIILTGSIYGSQQQSRISRHGYIE